MKKYLIAPLSILLTITLATVPVKATNFAGNEDSYIKLCSSSRLTRSKRKVCKEFNSYLKKKNEALKDSLSNSENAISDTNDKIEDVEDKIEKIDSSIEKKEKEIAYISESVTKFQLQIDAKENELKQKLYSMQSFYNTSYYIDFILKSKSMTDFFSRVASYNDINSYEQDLIEEINEQKRELDKQLDSLTSAKISLENDKNSANLLRNQFVELRSKQLQEYNKQKKEQKEVSEAQAKVDAALDAMISNAPDSVVDASVVSGSSKVGNKIAQAAVTKLGSRYYWGAQGPNMFDCSGFVYWAYNKAGVHIGRTTAAGYSRSGKAISRSQLQAGDVVTFSYGSGVAHIAIYIGGDKLCQAVGKGSSTVGQYPNQCVKVTSLSGYWERYVYNYRRLY